MTTPRCRWRHDSSALNAALRAGARVQGGASLLRLQGETVGRQRMGVKGGGGPPPAVTEKVLNDSRMSAQKAVSDHEVAEQWCKLLMKMTTFKTVLMG